MQLCEFDFQNGILFLPENYRQTLFSDAHKAMLVNDARFNRTSLYAVPGQIGEHQNWLGREAAEYNLGAKIYDDNDVSVLLDANGCWTFFQYEDHMIRVPTYFLHEIKIRGCRQVAVVQRSNSADLWVPEAYEEFLAQAKDRHKESMQVQRRIPGFMPEDTKKEQP